MKPNAYNFPQAARASQGVNDRAALARRLRPGKFFTSDARYEETTAWNKGSSRMSAVVLKVSEMKCEGCVKAVNEALTRVDGVRAAQVSLADGTARVEHADELSVAVLLDAVRSAGYEASIVE